MDFPAPEAPNNPSAPVLAFSLSRSLKWSNDFSRSCRFKTVGRSRGFHFASRVLNRVGGF